MSRSKKSETKELHNLYEKHEYEEISEDNCVRYCKGCGDFVVRIDANTNQRLGPDNEPSILMPGHFKPWGPLGLSAIMELLDREAKNDLAVHLIDNGYKEPDKLKKYMKKETAI